MSLIATCFGEGRRAQHPPVPRYPLRICRWRVLGRQYGAACVARPARRYPGRPDRHPRHLQGRPADTVARQFCAAGRDLRRTGCHVRAAAQQLNTTSEMWGTSRSICHTPLISFNLFSTQRGEDGPLRVSTAVGWNERPGASHAPEYPAATQDQSRRGNTCEHEAGAAAAAAKPRAALTPRSTPSGQAHYGRAAPESEPARAIHRGAARHFDLGPLLPRAEDPGLCQSCLTVPCAA